MTQRVLSDADWPEDEVVMHVDMDCFYASCERRRNPELDGEPVVVGMGYEEGDDAGAVATASYEAREYGVEAAQAITTALDHLPREEGTYVPVDMDYYEEVSSDVMDVLETRADTLRIESIDEAYLDVSESTNWDEAETYAETLREAIENEAGVPASIGVAPTMAVAKLASDYDKPAGLTVVPPDTVEEFFHPLDVEDLHGVGPVTARDLRDMGIETIGDLAERNPGSLGEEFGERGRKLYRRACGLDDNEVTSKEPPKSISRESAFDDPVEDAEVKREQIKRLASDVATRASREGATYRTVGIKAVEPPFEVNTRERTVSGPFSDAELVRDIALELVAEFDETPIRKIGVSVSNLSFAEGTQTRLDRWTEE